MTRAAWKGRWCLLDLLGLAAAVALIPFQGIGWDGGFESMEYRLTFVDGSGRPVPGVTLRVETQAGGRAFLFPINEFLPDQAPRSDAEGRLVFHHVSDAVEFGGRAYCNLLGMWFGETKAPQYDCVLSVADHELYRVPFNELRPRSERFRLAVSREWQDTDWPFREYTKHHECWDARRLQLFDGDGDGSLDRDERTAAGYFERKIDRIPHDEAKRTIEFTVVERTITLSLP